VLVSDDHPVTTLAERSFHLNPGNDQPAPVLRSTQAVCSGDALSRRQSAFARRAPVFRTDEDRFSRNSTELPSVERRSSSLLLLLTGKSVILLAGRFRKRVFPLFAIGKTDAWLHGLAPVQPRDPDLPEQGRHICAGQPFKSSIDCIEQSNWRSFGQAPIKGEIQSGNQDKWWKTADDDDIAFERERRRGTDR
jgi:hypothetical protein